jgi:hypothetical protein
MLTLMLIFSSLFPVHYQVEFSDASELRGGMPVVYRGLTIGEVHDVELGSGGKPVADVSIERKYRKLFREGCAARLEKDPPRVELIFVDESRPQLASNAVIPGLEGAMDYLLYGFGRVEKGVRDLHLKKEMQALEDDMDRAWGKGKEAFQKEWPVFKRKLVELKERLTGDAKAQKQIDEVVEEGDSRSK